MLNINIWRSLRKGFVLHYEKKYSGTMNKEAWDYEFETEKELDILNEIEDIHVDIPEGYEKEQYLKEEKRQELSLI